MCAARNHAAAPSGSSTFCTIITDHVQQNTACNATWQHTLDAPTLGLRRHSGDTRQLLYSSSTRHPRLATHALGLHAHDRFQGRLITALSTQQPSHSRRRGPCSRQYSCSMAATTSGYSTAGRSSSMGRQPPLFAPLSGKSNAASLASRSSWMLAQPALSGRYLHHTQQQAGC